MIARNKRPFCIALILTLRHPRRNRRNSVRVLVSYRALLRARAFRPEYSTLFLAVCNLRAADPERGPPNCPSPASACVLFCLYVNT